MIKPGNRKVPGFFRAAFKIDTYKTSDDPRVQQIFPGEGNEPVQPDKEHFFNSYFTRLAGNEQLRRQIEAGKTEEEIRESWEPELSRFKMMRKKYLLYK